MLSTFLILDNFVENSFKNCQKNYRRWNHNTRGMRRVKTKTKMKWRKYDRHTPLHKTATSDLYISKIRYALMIIRHQGSQLKRVWKINHKKWSADFSVELHVDKLLLVAMSASRSSICFTRRKKMTKYDTEVCSDVPNNVPSKVVFSRQLIQRTVSNFVNCAIK